jgi:hypothetical protein
LLIGSSYRWLLTATIPVGDWRRLEFGGRARRIDLPDSVWRIGHARWTLALDTKSTACACNTPFLPS